MARLRVQGWVFSEIEVEVEDSVDVQWLETQIRSGEITAEAEDGEMLDDDGKLLGTVMAFNDNGCEITEPTVTVVDPG